MASNYTKTVWTNNALQPINKTNLDKIEEGLFKSSDGAFIKTWYEAEADTNPFTDAEKAQLASPTNIQFDPQVSAPAFSEGNVWFDGVHKTLVIDGAFEGASIRPGHTQHTHVINNSGVLIEKGMAVRHDGVDVQGRVKIVKAIATSFNEARVFGVAQHNISNGAEGAIMTFGEISDVDTSLVTAGVPLYLSDTVAGTWITTAPAIVSQVGGALTSLASGRLFVSIINNTNLPTIYGGLQSKTTPLMSVTTTAQDIVGYVTETESVVTVDKTTGIITLPYAGAYRTNFTASISFPTDVSNRTVTFEVYDVTGATVVYSYDKNLSKDSTVDSLHFSLPEQAVIGNQVKIRVKASTAINVTFNTVVFDIESVNITL